jgi:hypothetical protein
MTRPALLLALGTACLAPVCAAPASADPGEPERIERMPRDRPDPLAQLLRRMDRHLQRHEVDGVTMDWRYEVSPSEEIRQTVVCQLLAYAELQRIRPKPRIRRDIVERADFLIGRLEEIRSHTPFDGMLAFSLLAAYETTGEARFLEQGTRVTRDLLAIPTSQCVLNGGLMVAMATAEYAILTGDAVAQRKTHDILAQLVPYQNPDGSFPHWCVGSRDIHYTGWMAMELIHIARRVDDPVIGPLLARMTAFLEARIGADGKARYEEPCPGEPGCTLYYYSRATGCAYDYDTRGWTVEPGYCVLLFDHMGSPQRAPVFQFLLSLEDGGTFPDLYGYWPPPEDPEYPWTIADTSVVNMSILFWSLATTLTDRVARGVAGAPAFDDEDGDGPPPDPPPTPPVTVDRPVTIAPHPVSGTCALRFSLAEPSLGSVTILDIGGRRLRTLHAGPLAAGEHVLDWDGRDGSGRAVPSGVYVVRVVTGTARRTSRCVVAR